MAQLTSTHKSFLIYVLTNCEIDKWDRMRIASIVNSGEYNPKSVLRDRLNWLRNKYMYEYLIFKKCNE